ncbi:MAG: ABC transporter substrate-binding protein [Acidimicrobiales bacterium]|nr:ABC transporter substrate-binding protein [Acidimicrobiales bacterium]
MAATSGQNITLGVDEIMAVKAYTKWLNSHGGVLGRRWKLVEENDNSSPQQAAELVRKCVTQDHANFILGPEETGTMAAGIPVADSLRTVMLTMGSGWNQGGVTSADVHSYAFPGLYDVFYQDDLDTAQRLIAPRHLTRVAVLEDAVPGGLPNGSYMKSLCRTYHCNVVGVQKLQPGQTDDTPQVLNLMAAKPQIIVEGLIPGPDTITAIKAIRAQSQTIPVSECSTCWTSGFTQAAGGPSVLQNVYAWAPVTDMLSTLSPTGANQSVLSELRTYSSAMKAAGFGTPDDINNASQWWPAGQELTAAIKKAGSVDETAVMHALQHQKLQSLYIFWNRTPRNHAGLKRVVTLTETWSPNGQLQLYRP